MSNRKVTVFYNGQEREGHVVEQKKDKVKVFVPNPGNYKLQDFNWFEINDVKFLN